MILVKIDGPKDQVSKIRYNNYGYFETYIEINKEWPTGDYIVSLVSPRGLTLATDNFSVKNFNMIIEEIDTKVIGTIDIKTTKSNEHNVLVISGNLQGQNLPENISIKISQNNEVIKILDGSVEPNGNFNSSIVLYDFVTKSPWDTGKYKLEIVEIQDKNNSLEIMTDFIISESGHIITDTKQGIMISNFDEQERIAEGEVIKIKENDEKVIEVFGKIESYIVGIPIYVSVVSDLGEIKEFLILGKKGGEYNAPVTITEAWSDGDYEIYVKYQDTIVNSIPFTLEGGIKKQLEAEVIELIEETAEKEIQVFEVMFSDFTSTEIVDLNFSTTAELKRHQRIPITLEYPDGSTQNFEIRADEKGQFSIPVIIENSWLEGDYNLSFVNEGVKEIFGQFTIIYERPTSDLFVLSEELQSANPYSAYKAEDELIIVDSQIPLRRGGDIRLDVTGGITDYKTGDLHLQIIDGKNIVSEYKIRPMLTGKFVGSTMVSEEFDYGFYELHAFYNEREIGSSEFLIPEPKLISHEFGSAPLKISQDQFVESGNLITVKLKGMVKDINYVEFGDINFTIYKPGGIIETFETPIKKWGYFSENILITPKWENGTYVITGEFNGKKFGHTYVQIIDFDFQWIKKYSEEWVDGDISTKQYINRINTLIKNNAIDSELILENDIPEWFKMPTKSFVENKISQEEFVQVLKFLLKD